MNIKSTFLIVFLSLLHSCERMDLSYRIKGQWAIESLTYKGKSCLDQLYINVIAFNDDGESFIPETRHFKEDVNATWELVKIENELQVRIKTSNTVFNDTFKITFIHDKKRNLTGIILKSDSVEIESYKLLQNY